MSTSAERQRSFKKRMAAGGFVQVSGWVRSHQAADIKTLLARLSADPDLTVGPVRNEASGRLEKLEKRR